MIERAGTHTHSKGEDVTPRALIIVAAVVLCTVTLGLAQQDANSPRSYSGYAHMECGPSNAPSLRIVLPAGSAPVPAAVPASAPRPAIELVVPAPLDRAVGQKLTVAREAAAGGLTAIGLSCPIVGECSRAQSGSLSLQRRADDGAITGEFGILWPDEAARQTVVRGKFVAAWRETSAKCG
jgi:hypothetical protein